MPFAAVLALAVAAASSAPAGAQEDARTRAAVRAELERYYADLSARNWDAFADHFWPGAELVTIWQPPGEDEERVVYTSVPDFIRSAPAGPGSREIFEERMLEVEIRIQGPLAQAWTRYTARFGDPGDVQSWEGTDAFTLLNHDGRWRITALAYAAH